MADRVRPFLGNGLSMNGNHEAFMQRTEVVFNIDMTGWHVLLPLALVD